MPTLPPRAAPILAEHELKKIIALFNKVNMLHNIYILRYFLLYYTIALLSLFHLMLSACESRSSYSHYTDLNTSVSHWHCRNTATFNMCQLAPKSLDFILGYQRLNLYYCVMRKYKFKKTFRVPNSDRKRKKS